MTRDVAETTEMTGPAGGTPGHQGYEIDAARPVLMRVAARPAGTRVAEHAHPRGQVLWALEGVLHISAEAGAWIVPPSHAVWIRGGLRHEVRIESAAQFRNLFLDPSLPGRAEPCAVLQMTPLMRALVLRLAEMDLSSPPDPPTARLTGVLLDELARLPASPLHLPSGADPRLTRVTRALSADPADPRPLAELARETGASLRTLERLFLAETGLGFRAWRTRLRLLSALDRLEAGESGKSVALRFGYRSPSAFVAAFHREFGAPPQRFLKAETDAARAAPS